MSRCDWCEKHNDTYPIAFYGGSMLQICGVCFMDIQKSLFGEE
jgi:hypothetical protein